MTDPACPPSLHFSFIYLYLFLNIFNDMADKTCVRGVPPLLI